MENFFYEALRHARLNLSMILVGRIILLVDGKRQTNSGKRYADIMEAVIARRRLLDSPIKLIVYCRLDNRLTWKRHNRLRKSSNSGFKFSDLVQISKANRPISSGNRQRIKVKTPRDKR